MIEVTDGFGIDNNSKQHQRPRFTVDVTQRKKYTDTVTAEFDSVTSAAKFALTCLENVENARVTISAQNYTEEKQED
jgi:hypothetical protein